MALVLRTVENRPLTWEEGDDNLLYLSNSIVDVSAALPTPGGVDGELQYNDNGAFAGVPDLTYNSGLLQATGSFQGNVDGTATTASYVSAADVDGPYGLNSVLSASLAQVAQTASYVELAAGPGISVNGLQITASVRSVNGLFPTNGNIQTSLTATKTGLSSSLILSASGDITASLVDGLVWIVAGETGPTSGSNGLVYIYASSSVGAWYPVSPTDQAANDARYLMLTPQSPLAGPLNLGSQNLTNGGTITATSFAGTASWAVSASWAPATEIFPFTGSATITGSLVVTGSADTTGNAYVNQSSYATYFQPYNGFYGVTPLKPINPNTTASAAPSWWGSQQGAGAANGGPGRVFFGDQNIGQIGLLDTDTSNPWAGAIKLIRNSSGTNVSTGRVPYHTLITNNATLIDSAATISVAQANGRTHIFTVTGSMLARDGVSLGTNITNSHIISGSVNMTGSFTVNGAAYVPSLLALTGSSLYTTNTSNVGPDESVYIGSGSGQNTVGGYAVMVGNEAGNGFGNNPGAVLIGYRAGKGATGTSVNGIVAIGGNAALNATGIIGGSIYIGSGAGFAAVGGYGTVNIGQTAGQQASNAIYSVFVGHEAGFLQASATYNIMLGYQAGKVASAGLALGSNNVVIGNSIGLPAGRTNSVNIGGAIFATGIYSNPGTAFTGSVQTARVGIATNTPAYTLDVSGSGNFVSGLTVTGSLRAANITGSLLGTASWALNIAGGSIATSGSTIYSTDPSTSGFSTNNSIYLGSQAGQGSSTTARSVFIGQNAGSGSTSSEQTVMIGRSAGINTTQALGAVFVGTFAGTNADNSYYGTYIGAFAGYGAFNANSAVFVGDQAGYGANDTYNSQFIGSLAGYGATYSNYSNYIGTNAGYSASYAQHSNFFGFNAGYQALYSNNSNFLGYYAGYSSSNAYNSTFVGYQAGANTLGTSGVGPNNIVIGTNITLPDNTANSMNIGGVLFGTGFQDDTLATDPYPTPVAGGKIGIGVVSPAYTLDVAGSGNFTNNLTVSGSFITTGSLSVVGTATVTSASVQGTVVTNIGDTFTGTAAVTKIVSLTAAEYSGLGSTDANTLYIVI